MSHNSPQISAISSTSTARSRPPQPVWRILVVENNIGDMEALARGLRRHGHDVCCVRTGGEALAVFRDVDIVLIDLELPDVDGLEVCREIRVTSDIAMIAVTARQSELDRVLGLHAGADDYVIKPYGFRELMARMHAVMRRRKPNNPVVSGHIRSHGELTIDANAREVRVGGRRVDVTRKEFDLLWLLAASPDVVVPRQRVVREVWGDSWSRRTVDTHVSSLRNKLGDGDWIVTVRGVGFRLGDPAHRADLPA